MKRFVHVLAAALTAGLLMGGSGATAGTNVVLSAAGDGDAEAGMASLPTNQSADVYGVGAGKVNFGFVSFNMSAHEGPNGDFGHVAAKGTDQLGVPIVSYSVAVDCVHIHSVSLLSVDYDVGVISAVVTSVSPVPNVLGVFVGESVGFLIKDGGNPSAGVPVDDFYAPSAPLTAAGTSWKLLYNSGEFRKVTSGNVNIKGP
jgi:hypothetical protein